MLRNLTSGAELVRFAAVGVAALLTVWSRLRSFGGDDIAYARDRSRTMRGQPVPGLAQRPKRRR